MKFYIDDLLVFFPYPMVYKEQMEYMKSLKKCLDNQGHGIIEMPTGTGKTVSLLSLFLSYLIQYPDKYKRLIYCTRTVGELDKTLKELQFIQEQRKKEMEMEFEILAMGLTARKNLCINEDVKQQKERESIDAACRKKTASWVRNKYKKNDESQLCSYYEGFMDNLDALNIKEGIFTLEDMQNLGKQANICPYFLCRHYIQQANIIVYNYLYLIDPKNSSQIPDNIKNSCIVVFDEAHNIDDVCIEAFSFKINKIILEQSSKNLITLKNKIEDINQQDLHRLESEYKNLLKGIKPQDQELQLPKNIAKQVMPGNIRRADHFINFMKRIVIFLKNILKSKEVRKFSPINFFEELTDKAFIEKRPLSFVSERLTSLMNTLEIAETDEFLALSTIASFCTTMASGQAEKFTIILEPNPNDSSMQDPLLNLACLDSSLAMKNIFEMFKSVILTSGTMSPMEMYPKILDFKPLLMQSIDIQLQRNSISPIVVSRGNDQMQISSEYQERNNKSVMRNYGNLLIELTTVIPDGIICFFPSYRYMEEVILNWNEMGILELILQNKLLYIESKDTQKTSISLMNYRKACDCGRGAVFLSIARGKIAEGIDFDNHYGRAVVMFGVPFQYTKSRTLLARLEYLSKEKNIKESDFLIFDAMRQAAQCVGRVIRGKTDYGMMIFADYRFGRQSQKEKLPNWIKQSFVTNTQNLSTDMTINLARDFFKKMSQVYTVDKSTYFTESDLQN